MDEITTHRVQWIRISIENVLIVEEKFVRFKQLLVFKSQFVSWNAVLHDLPVLKVIITDGLSSKHNHSISIDHMQSNQPNLPFTDEMECLPRLSVAIKLLDARPVWICLESHCIYVPFRKCATVWTTNCLRKRRQRRLVLAREVKQLTLLQILTF